MRNLKHVLYFLILILFNPILKSSIEDSVIQFNLKQEDYPPYKISLIILQHKVISDTSKKESFIKLDPFINKEELIILTTSPELLIDNKSIDEAFKSKTKAIINLEQPHLVQNTEVHLEDLKAKKINGLPVQLYEFIGSDNHDMKPIREKLNKSKKYNIIFAESWFQPLFSYDLRHFIHIDVDFFNVKIHGYISQYKEKYLHSELNLRFSLKDKDGIKYKKPNILINFNDLQKELKSNDRGFRKFFDKLINLENLNIFSYELKKSHSSNSLEDDYFKDLYEIKEERKLAESEYNYFDHPYFGVLIKIEHLVTK